MLRSATVAPSDLLAISPPWKARAPPADCSPTTTTVAPSLKPAPRAHVVRPRRSADATAMAALDLMGHAALANAASMNTVLALALDPPRPRRPSLRDRMRSSFAHIRYLLHLRPALVLSDPTPTTAAPPPTRAPSIHGDDASPIATTADHPSPALSYHAAISQHHMDMLERSGVGVLAMAIIG